MAEKVSPYFSPGVFSDDVERIDSVPGDSGGVVPHEVEPGAR